MCAGKRLLETVDRLGEAGDLFGQPPGLGLLGGEQVADGRELILHHLQLVDRFPLGGLQSLGLLDQLFGGLCRARLQLTDGDGAIEFRHAAGIGAPEADRSCAGQEDDQCRTGKGDRLGADAGDAVEFGVACELDHEMAMSKRKRVCGIRSASGGSVQHSKRRERWLTVARGHGRREK
jgi:hypothetical protein